MAAFLISVMDAQSGGRVVSHIAGALMIQGLVACVSVLRFSRENPVWVSRTQPLLLESYF